MANPVLQVNLPQEEMTEVHSNCEQKKGYGFFKPWKQEVKGNSRGIRGCKHSTITTKALWAALGHRLMSKVTEELLQQLNMDYTLREHLRALYKVGPSFKEPFDDDDSIDEE
ncbi:hypothetical protein HAX54_010268 [Datura stramonium]|uniref:Uncharacterized protein n=1 Tax=Datura stramonium TaxID=4076 RepID=A0ABS8THS5_DATST|nr:hypothetical protein [Datura stramonium]